jgi:hypothetical protein
LIGSVILLALFYVIPKAENAGNYCGSCIS